MTPTGKDSTQEFEDINHSKTATKLLDKYAIGDYAVRGLCSPLLFLKRFKVPIGENLARVKTIFSSDCTLVDIDSKIGLLSQGGEPPTKKAKSAVTAQDLPQGPDNLFLQILKVLGPVLVIIAAIYLSQVFQK